RLLRHRQQRLEVFLSAQLGAMALVLRADNVQCLVVRKPHRPELLIQEISLFGAGVDAYFGGC
ncbi:hypothetical protein MOY_12152, partial [Halomonas sp. GFAJ-1]